MAGKAEDVYAESLFEVAAEADRLDEIYRELDAVAGIFRENPDFVRLLSSPAVTKKEKIALISDIFDGRADTLLANFLKVLAQNGRIACFEGIRAAFEQRYQKENNILAVTSVTAIKLSPALRERLVTKLQVLTGQTVLLTEEVDPAVLGGVLLRYDSKEIDGTVRERLSALKRQIARQVV